MTLPVIKATPTMILTTVLVARIAAWPYLSPSMVPRMQHLIHPTLRYQLYSPALSFPPQQNPLAIACQAKSYMPVYLPPAGRVRVYSRIIGHL